MLGVQELSGFGSGRAAPIPEILWTPFREGSGTTAASVVGPNITLNGSGTWATGPRGVGSGWGNLAGGGYGTTAASLTYGSNIITVCHWAYVDFFGPGYPGAPYFSNTSTHGFILDTGGTFAYMPGATTARAEDYPYAGWTTDAWQHWTIVWDNSTTSGEITMYYNGVLQTPTTTYNDKDGTANFTAGTLSVLGDSAGGSSLRGRMSDVRIYNRQLSAEEAVAVYNDVMPWT